MMYSITLGEGTTYADYREMMRNHELDDVLAAAKESVEAFIRTHPTHIIDGVRLTITKTDEVDKIDKIVMEQKEHVPRD